MTAPALAVTEGTHPFRILTVNQKWLDACGFTSEEVVGKTAALM